MKLPSNKSSIQIRQELRQQIIDLKTSGFEDLALQIFQYQARFNPIYNQYLSNAKEQRFEYDAHATSIAAGNYIGAEINDDINPGNSVTADIVFDVPLGGTPTTAELHGSTGSQGVKVNLQ